MGETEVQFLYFFKSVLANRKFKPETDDLQAKR